LENSGTTRDAETSKRFKNWADNQKIKVMTNSYSQADKRFQDSYFFEFENNIEEIKKLAIDSENLEDSEDNKNWMLREIESGLGFPLTAERAVQLRDKNLEEIKTGRAKNAINRLELDILRDPGGTIQKLMMPPESNNYPEITDPLIREQKIKLGERLLETQQKERRTEEDRIKGENHDAEALEIGNLYATGKLKIEHVQAAKYLSGGEKIQLTDKIRERQDRLARGEIIKTNFSTYARIQDMIYSGQPKREIIKRIALASEKDLSEQDAETLLNKSTAYGGHIEDQWRKKSYDFLKSQIAASGTNMIGDFVNPEEAIDFFKATNLLDSTIADARRKGKPFPPEQIFEEARKILPLVKRTQKQLAEAAKIRIRGEKPKINIPERKKGESPADYLKRIGE
jgi:hypothetical protein